MLFFKEVTSPLLVSHNPLPSYIVIIYILPLLLCSGLNCLSGIIFPAPASQNRISINLLFFFVHLVLVQSLRNIWHFAFPLPILCLSLSLFCKRLRCDLCPNPFKILCTFLNYGNFLTRQEDEKAGSHVRRTCYICCDNREECSDLLHLGVKALCCVSDREREGEDLNCWSCSVLPLSPARIAHLLSISPFLPISLSSHSFLTSEERVK